MHLTPKVIKPSSSEDLYKLIHTATEKLNELRVEFLSRRSDIETPARNAIDKSFQQIAKAYGFANADPEELFATHE